MCVCVCVCVWGGGGGGEMGRGDGGLTNTQSQFKHSFTEPLYKWLPYLATKDLCMGENA